MMHFLLSFAFLFSVLGHASLTESDRAEFVYKNFLKDKNPGFENAKAGWTASGGSFAIANSGTEKLIGNASATWDSNSGSQTLSSSAITVPNGLFGSNGLAYCKIRTPSGTATHTLETYDGTNILATQTIISSTTPTYTYVNFPWPSSGTVLLRLKAVASNEPSVTVDDCYVGSAANLSTVSQASIYGTATTAGVASCQWSVNTAGTFTSYGADTDCGAPTVTGFASAPSTKIPGITFASLPPGDYEVTATGTFYKAHSNNVYCHWRFTDGTNTFGNSTIYTGGATGAAGQSFTGRVSYTTAQSNITFNIQAGPASGTNACDIDNSTTMQSFVIIVKRFPNYAESAFRANQIGWKVDATIAGANVSLGTAAVTAYGATGIEDTGLTLTNNSGTGNLTAQIPCSSTNTPSGTTCSSGSESVGVAFTVPQAGDVLACVSFAHNIVTAATGVVNTTFEIVETPANAQTVTAEGKSKVQDGINTASTTITFPQHVCGVFTFASAGQKVLRLFFEQAVTATVTTSQIFADAGANNGQRDIHWEVYPINQMWPQPLIVNSLNNSSSGITQVETANINCDSSSAITSQHGSWVSSVGNISGGACAITLTSGIFSATPYCTVSYASGSFSLGLIVGGAASSATAVAIDCEDDASTACTAYDVILKCMGAK